MKVVTFSAIKGGVGKTTLTYNFGEWLAKKDYKVLLIDLDHQCNLTNIYTHLEKSNTIGEVFKSPESARLVKIKNVAHNIDLIPGNLELDALEKSIENQSKKEMLLYLWIKNNYDLINPSKYDFILIDTHPDFSTITKNAIAVSDYILSPITPSEHGYSAKFNLETRLNRFRGDIIDYSTGASYIDAKLLFVANMVKHNTKASKELLTHIKDDSDVIAVIPEKELFNRSTLEHKSIVSMEEEQYTFLKHKNFFKQINATFLHLTNHLNK